MKTDEYKEIELNDISNTIKLLQYYQYPHKEETIELLDRYIRSDKVEHTTRVDYSEQNQNGRFYRFDYVELCDSKISKLFILCSRSEFDKKTIALYKQMKLYQEITDAEVFLAYIKIDLKSMPTKAIVLYVVSLAEIEELFTEKPFMRHEIESFSAFYDILKELIKDELRLRKTVFYRGQSNNKYEPIPSIFRSKFITVEDRFYHEAIRRKPMEFTENMTTFDNLVKMQHYELPTRLLDITTNALVALFFACQEAINNDGSEADGEVLIYSMWDTEINYYDSNDVTLLANLVKRPSSFVFSETSELLIHDMQKDNPKYDGKSLKEDSIHKVLCVLPKLNNERINNQDGAFFIFGMGEKRNEPAVISQLPYIINIKAKAKTAILEELKIFGIDEASLFPETDKAMKQIKQDCIKYIDLLLSSQKNNDLSLFTIDN